MVINTEQLQALMVRQPWVEYTNGTGAEHVNLDFPLDQVGQTSNGILEIDGIWVDADLRELEIRTATLNVLIARSVNEDPVGWHLLGTSTVRDG